MNPHKCQFEIETVDALKQYFSRVLVSNTVLKYQGAFRSVSKLTSNLSHQS